jgi:hypothetical protein
VPPGLPLVLAGPILRRVEPRLVAVWVALSEPHAVLLTVFEGRQVAGTGSGVFTGGTPRMRGATNTLRLGDRLHVAVVVAELEVASQTTLVPGVNYSYNVAFAPVQPGHDGGKPLIVDALEDPTADLKSLGFLRDDPIGGRPNKALGYTAGELPGFALPPPTLTDLRILHGSCRRPAFTYADDNKGERSFDGLAWVDDLILEWRRGTATASALDPIVRPHQLFLTGDQIYADDVSSTMLPMLNRVGTTLIGGDPERLPTRYPPDAEDPKREAYLNAPKQQGFDTIAKFVEDCRKKGVDPLERLKEDRRVRVLQDRCFDRAFQLLYGRPYVLDPDIRDLTDADGLRRWPADLAHFPARLRQPVIECEAQFTADEDNHLLSFGEYCAMYLAVWSNAVWELDTAGKPKLTTIEEAYAVPTGPLPQLWELHSCFESADEAITRTDATKLKARFEKMRADPEEQSGFARDTRTLTDFYDSLPRVRRALANVPTYMVVDDHDVTDDWNLGRAWRDRVYTSALGRRVITSALVAYVAFQDWGNDPLRYGKGPYRTTLDLASTFQPLSAAKPAADDPREAAAALLAKLFGLNQPDPESPAPQLKWHFSIDGPRHRVLVLDIRTRRAFRSRYLPPALLSEAALVEQVPDPVEHPLPAGIEMVLVVSQTPPVLPTIATRYIVPVKTRIEEFSNHARFRRLTGLEPDNEIWPGDDVAFEALLKRLAAYGKVVVLSGEVHFGAAGELTYWTRGQKRLDLAPELETDLNRKNPIASAALRAAFDAGGIGLSGIACVTIREGNDEWLVTDVQTERMFLVRKEVDGLNVYDDAKPARIAQFVSSGMKNLKGDIFKLGRFLGFAFALSDLTPAERLIWEDNTPAPVKAAEGVRFHPAVRDRLGSEPVLLPTIGWPPGTKLVSRPDAAWRADAVQDERADAERPEFARPEPLPGFDANDVPGTYAKIANEHAALLDGKFRFARGVLLGVNYGVVRFERDGAGHTIACQDLYTNQPGKHEGTLVNTYRIDLDRFGDERPKLSFAGPPAEGA